MRKASEKSEYELNELPLEMDSTRELLRYLHKHIAIRKFTDLPEDTQKDFRLIFFLVGKIWNDLDAWKKRGYTE